MIQQFKIKKGQKLVCKTNIPPGHSDLSNLYTPNNVYEILRINLDNLSTNGRVFYIISCDKSNIYSYVFSNATNYSYIWDYFYTLAEWRDLQIDSIFEDE